MFLETTFTEQFEHTDNLCKERLGRVLQGIPTAGPAQQYNEFSDLYASAQNQGKIFLVEDGAVGYELENKTLFHYDSGDLIGLEQLAGLPQPKFYAESPVTLVPYDRDTLWHTTTGDTERARQWSDYLLTDCARHSAVIASLDTPTDKASLGFQTYVAGETIIEEGTASDTVYSIVEGHAQVYVKGIKVGEVLEDEIFGAMSLLTNSPRTASVVASKRCLVMVVPRCQFEVMIKTHPRICISLMENMARQIVSLNEQVTGAHSQAS